MTYSVDRRGFAAALLSLTFGCHGAARDSKAMAPSAMCNACCQQTFEACKMEGSHGAAACTPQLDQCTAACEGGDDNETCVAQINRELAVNAPKSATAAKMIAPVKHSECDNKGTWSLQVAEVKGNSKGCAALDSIPKQVSFRIGRDRENYVLYDLTRIENWTDEFMVASNDQQCEVVLARNNKVDDAHPRALTVKLTEHGHAVSGTLKYAEENQPNGGCSLDATVSGTVVAPQTAPTPAPANMAAPAPQPMNGTHGLHR